MGDRCMELGQCPPRDRLRHPSLDESKNNREKENSGGNKIRTIRYKRESIRLDHTPAAIGCAKPRSLSLRVKLLRNSFIIRPSSPSKAHAFIKPSKTHISHRDNRISIVEAR